MLSLREEFRLKNFGFGYSPVKDFVTSPWFPAPVVIIYRTVFGVYSLSWIIFLIVEASIYGADARGFFFITRWSYMVLMIYFLISFPATIAHYVRRKQGKEHTLIRNQDAEQSQSKLDECSWFHRVLWVFYTVAVDMALAVTIYYWAIDYDGNGVTLSDVNVHILNAVFMILDHTLSSMPWRLLHFIYAIIFGILYAIATVFYWLFISKTEPIYKALDYSKNPGLAVGLMTGALFILIPLIHLFFYGVYRLRCFLVKKCMSDDTAA